MPSMVMYVVLWSILPNLEGEDDNPGVKDKTESTATEAKLRTGKKEHYRAQRNGTCSMLHAASFIRV